MDILLLSVLCAVVGGILLFVCLVMPLRASNRRWRERATLAEKALTEKRHRKSVAVAKGNRTRASNRKRARKDREAQMRLDIEARDARAAAWATDPTK